MANYQVTLTLINGYHRDEQGSRDLDQPILLDKDFFVSAENEADAIWKAKEQDDSKLSTWDSYATEI